MEQSRLDEIVDKLIEILCAEQNADISQLGLENFSYAEKREIFRVLSIRREPAPLSQEFMKLQNELLSYETKERGIVEISTLNFFSNMAIFYGDIRSLKTDAIVNAGNPSMLGTYDPTDTSTKSVIMQAGGLQIRQELSLLKNRTGRDEERGEAKITKAYNLPCKYIIHTVGPEIKKGKEVSYNDKVMLANCYKSCLNLAKDKGLGSVAFCAVSTGVYNFPKQLASKIAVATVKDWFKENKSDIKVVFCVYDLETKKYYEENFRDYDINTKNAKKDEN